jgi:malonyl-CoA O-methyltransferase
VTHRIDRAALKRNLRRTAPINAEANFFACEIDRRMQERLDYVRLAPRLILDLGCGNGHSLPGLQARYPDACCLGVDWEVGLLPGNTASARQDHSLQHVPPPFHVAAAAERLPLPANEVDLVWANLLAPWLEDPAQVLREALRVLRPGGLLMFSALGPYTLRELNAGFGDGGVHTQAFIDLHDLGDLLLESGFANPVADMEMLTLTYASLDALVAELRATGATCVMRTRRKTLAGRGLRQKLEAYCKALQGKRADARLPASFEILYAHAWKGSSKTSTFRRSATSWETMTFHPPIHGNAAPTSCE